MYAQPSVPPQHPPVFLVHSSMLQSLAALYTSVASKLWTDAPHEQRKLTLQLARNSLYFTTAVFVIKQFGEQIAI